MKERSRGLRRWLPEGTRAYKTKINNNPREMILATIAFHDFAGRLALRMWNRARALYMLKLLGIWYSILDKSCSNFWSSLKIEPAGPSGKSAPP